MPIAVEEELSGYKFCQNRPALPDGRTPPCAAYFTMQPARVVRTVTSWTSRDLGGPALSDFDVMMDQANDGQGTPERSAEHLRLLHDEERLCEVCGERTMQATLLDRHVHYPRIHPVSPTALWDPSELERDRLAQGRHEEAREDNEGRLAEQRRANDLQAEANELQRESLRVVQEQNAAILAHLTGTNGGELEALARGKKS